jgi:hypothetical protein
MTERSPLFYVSEPRFGCTQPVYAGDILRLRTCDYMIIVISCRDIEIFDALDENSWTVEECEVMLDGKIQRVLVSDLEAAW